MSLATANGIIIKERIPKTSAIIRKTTKITLTIMNLTDTMIEADSKATIKNKCHICHPESLTRIKMLTSRKLLKNLSQPSRISLWASSKSANFIVSRHSKIRRHSILSNTCLISTPCISKVTNSSTHSLWARVIHLPSKRSMGLRCSTTSQIHSTQQPPRTITFTSEVLKVQKDRSLTILLQACEVDEQLAAAWLT